ncbi:zinc finger MYM-type protein 1 [Trichonephila clavipes]|nr:zinc finger MYM-type protein 1 [Trichonephila clavipes]
MEQSKKNITNADTLASERERNLAKENGETQQTNITDENMKDLDDLQPSEKDVVQRENISNAPTEKCLENVGFEFEKYVDVEFLQTNGLLLDNCRGKSFDNAANMSGRYNGVQALLKEKNKFANYKPCAAHSLNLVGAESVKKLVNFTANLPPPKVATSGRGPACPPLAPAPLRRPCSVKFDFDCEDFRFLHKHFIR